jgi:septicolysin
MGSSQEEKKMKLAEALQERADLNRKIEQLDSRLCSNCLVQEGEKPLENPEELLQELEYSVGRLEYLMERINITNSKTLVDGKTMTACIARKDALILKQRVLRNIIEEASQNTHRATRTEIKILSTVDVAKIQKQADDIAKEVRLLDNALQASNWTVELEE